MKSWTIPTILRELRRAVLEQSKGTVDIMKVDEYDVAAMVKDLTAFHMGKEMQIPGQTAIPVDDTDEGM